MTTTPEDLPDDIAALQAALVVERAKRIAEAARAARVEAELAVAKAKASDDQTVIAHQQLQIAKLTRQALWPALGTHGAAARSDGAGARGAREFGH